MLLPVLCGLFLMGTLAQSASAGEAALDCLNISERLAILEERTKHLAQPPVIDSCSGVPTTGTYQLRLPLSTVSVPVVCETNSSSFSNIESDTAGGGWLVFQHRLDGSVNFGRSGSEYRGGFGTVDPRSEFWLGLEVLHQLTKNAHYELVIELRDENGRYGYARYSQFVVAGEADRYKLTTLGTFTGTIGSRLENSRDEAFYARDDVKGGGGSSSCGWDHGGGWWYYNCQDSMLNGPYKRDGSTQKGIFWKEFADAATYSRMMIRRKVPSRGSNRDDSLNKGSVALW
ncbi:conserved hypothetical protein [Culex quinquefasciatus]|uniref:Fibrinogen C-terminal domain-containing protein n=1 Tax=Culex quinquefasciatus TaxID=7176 RepID=B0X1X0_CULQU|nr:conserved hypothetical protein [Culex quinquefasciatus]|eukprot:XP_001863642.1 conserved hypothetical protein [Culex quinquefasciatus]